MTKPPVLTMDFVHSHLDERKASDKRPWIPITSDRPWLYRSPIRQISAEDCCPARGIPGLLSTARLQDPATMGNSPPPPPTTTVTKCITPPEQDVHKEEDIYFIVVF